MRRGPRSARGSVPPVSPAAALEALVNAVVGLDVEHARILNAVDGRRARLRITAPVPVTLDVRIEASRLRVAAASDVPADVELEGSAAAMMTLLRGGGDTLPGAAGVRIAGDLAVLEAMKTAFSSLQPDFEEPLAQLVGDRLAPTISRGARDFVSALSNGVAELRDIGAEYLREETTLLVAAHEVEEFSQTVQQLSDDAERVVKRFELLERRLDAAS